MIYFYKDELVKICNFLEADYDKVCQWLETNKTTDKYIEFELISDLGQSILTLVYGKNLGSSHKIVCQVSYLGTNFLET